MKDDYVTFDKTSVYLEIISLMILFLKHGEDPTDTHSSPASKDEQDINISQYVGECAINTDYPLYDDTIHNNIISHDYDVIYNIIYNDIGDLNVVNDPDVNIDDLGVVNDPDMVDDLDTTFGADQIGSMRPMDGG